MTKLIIKTVGATGLEYDMLADFMLELRAMAESAIMQGAKYFEVDVESDVKFMED